MAYFLKKTNLKNRTYLAIYESFYSHDKKGTAHRCYKSLGSVETLIENGMEDPVAFYQAEVDSMNAEKKNESVRKISDVSPLRNLGYFPLKSVMDSLDAAKYIDLFSLVTDFRFTLSEMLSSLVYARCVNPCSKRRTFHEVIPSLFESQEYSYDQLLEGLEFMGENYQKFVEIFTVQTAKKYGMDTSTTYFDCTNFYFEIDREDDFRRKGPSKENRHDPIIGLGLLLDADQIPVGMQMYPGNRSEKPVLREVVDSLKKRSGMTGRTVHVADKGLNSADNIASSLLCGDGYIFSKSVKGLGKKEKQWVTLENDSNAWHDVRRSDGSVAYRYKSVIDEFEYEVTDSSGKKKKVMLREKRLVTYNSSLAKKQKKEIERLAAKADAMTASEGRRSQYGESSRYIRFESVDRDGTEKKTRVVMNREKIAEDLRLAGYNMIVTSETDMDDRRIYDTYHNLWMIEESFRLMKSDLDARPVFVQKENTIKGHFLVCYIAVLLERLLQLKVLDRKFSSSELCEFFRNFKVVKTERKYTNVTRSSDTITRLVEITGLPLDHYYLSETQIKKVLNYRF